MENGLLLDSLQVKGFRAFEDLQIEKLGRVNLITGKNNVGKTSLLEALQIYARNGEPSAVMDMLERRDEMDSTGGLIRTMSMAERRQRESNDQENIRHLFHGRSISNLTDCQLEVGSLESPSEKVVIRLERREVERLRATSNGSLFDDDEETTIIESVLVLKITKGELSVAIPFSSNYRRNRLVQELAEESIPHALVWSTGLDEEKLKEWWDKVALTSAEERVIEALQIVVKDIARVTMIGMRMRESVPIVLLKDSDARLPMKSLGEGINRMFGLALALVSSANGMLMVDEIETGLHYSVQADMWKLIFRTARTLNVQVFATTHSSDCIRAFEEAARGDTEVEGMLIRLESKNGRVKVVSLDEEDLEIVVNEGIEVR